MFDASRGGIKRRLKNSFTCQIVFDIWKLETSMTRSVEQLLHVSEDHPFESGAVTIIVAYSLH